MRNRSITIWVVVMVSVFAKLSQGLIIQDESAVIDAAYENVTFTLTFSEVPDFFTVDQHGRLADSFQYLVEIHNHPDWDLYDSVIRGSEITADIIPIRSVTGGSWGDIRGLAPYELSGPTLTFTTTLDILGADGPGPVLSNGQFKYWLYVMEYGATTDQAFSTSIPEPATLFLLGLGTLMLRKKQ